MNVGQIFSTMNRHDVRYLLIGGMNFALRHQPLTTFDVDLWIDDTKDNRRHCELALAELQASWGPTDESWQPVSQLASGWLDAQHVFCTLSPAAAIDIFRSVVGLPNWQFCSKRAIEAKTSKGVRYLALCDQDMLECQLALPEGQRNQTRIAALRAAISQAEAADE
jgi:hypothetical protein